MLQYHPATDFYHCWLRVSSILNSCGHTTIEVDRMRIMDFFVSFPRDILRCSIPQSHAREVRRFIKDLKPGYEDETSVRQIFPHMTVIQRQVFLDMVAKGVVAKDKFRDGLLSLSEPNQIPALAGAVAELWQGRNEPWFKALVSALMAIPLNGPDGLKDRTGMLEYRYDQ